MREKVGGYLSVRCPLFGAQKEISQPEVSMGIAGAHVLLYTSEPQALRATLRNVFGWKHVDAGILAYFRLTAR